MNPLYCMPELTCWANDNDALIPEVWAMEALRVLRSNMVMGNLVNRDYSDDVSNFGDVVNTSRPADFVGKRKTDDDNVTDQDAVSPNIPVPLNQHFHVSFVIKDGELSKALPSLLSRYMEPAARELAEKIDQVLCGQAVRLSAYTEGRLGEMDKTNAADFVLDVNTALDINRAPMQGRNLVLGPRAQKAALGADLFVSTEKRGDAGTALYSASLGHVYGMDTYMDQNMSYVASASADISTGAVDTGGAEEAGYTGAIDTTVTASDVSVGDYVVIEGDGEAYRVSAVTDSSGAQITVVGGLQHDIAEGAAVTVYKGCTVNHPDTTQYAAGYSKYIALNGMTSGKGPQKGQWVTFGTGASSHSYTVIDVTGSGTAYSVLLDRPLDATVAHAADVFVGPAGGVNLAFHRDAIALVNRPLAEPDNSFGVRSFVADYEGIAMRVVMQYDSQAQGTRVTFDLLCGVAVLDERLAVVLYS